MALTVRPYVFGGVQLRGVRREAIHVQSSVAAAYVVLHEASVMDRSAIPDQYDWSREVAHQAAEKRHDFYTADVVVGVELDVHAESRSAGRNRQRCDGGNAVPAIAVIEKRRVALGSPRTSNGGDQKEAAFVYKSEVGAQPTRFFLI
jgi:hypothetical protein